MLGIKIQDEEINWFKKTSKLRNGLNLKYVSIYGWVKSKVFVIKM